MMIYRPAKDTKGQVEGRKERKEGLKEDGSRSLKNKVGSPKWEWREKSWESMTDISRSGPKFHGDEVT